MPALERSRWSLLADSDRHRFARAACAAAAVAALVACGGRKASEERAANSSDVPQVVSECLRYEEKIRVCMHRDTGFANRPMLLARTDADRARIGAMCSENLRRLEAACR
jgi:hypothetical protein